jgi:dTDP-4-dehydrorhamnose reductase
VKSLSLDMSSSIATGASRRSIDRIALAREELGSLTLLLGASGLLGESLLQALSASTVLATHFRRQTEGTTFFDVRTSSVHELVEHARRLPDVAVLLLGNTKIDDCARDPVKSAEINVQGIIRVLADLRELGIRPVFVSSDAVFDGSRAFWRESDAVCPITVYGRQKAAVEGYLSSMDTPWLIVRLPKLLATSFDKRCMLSDWLRKLGVSGKILCATDQFFTPAAAEDVASSISLLITRKAQGVFHLGGPVRLSRRALLGLTTREFSKYAKIRAEIVECSLVDVPALERRPLDASLNSEKFTAKYGSNCRPPSEIVERAVADYFYNSWAS